MSSTSSMPGKPGCGIRIRRAVHADLDALCVIEQGCFGTDGDAFPRRVLAHLVDKAQGVCFVAEADGRIAGYISLLTRRGAHNVRIYSVAVAASARGCGAGRALVEAAIDYARRGGFDRVTLEVRTDNAPAIALYTKRGFVSERSLPGYYHDGSDGQRMTLTIHNS